MHGSTRPATSRRRFAKSCCGLKGQASNPTPIGSHVNVGVLIDGRPETRCYSLVGDFNPAGYRIAVRLAPDSRGGSRYMWTLKPGARIEISSPASLLEIDWSQKSYCLIAGGIGITPMLGIAGALMRRNADVAFHYAVKSRADAAFLDELSDLLGDRLIVHAGDEGKRIDLDHTFAACRRMRRRSCAARCACSKRHVVAGRRRGARRPTCDTRRLARAVCCRRHHFGFGSIIPGREILVPENKSMLDALNEAGFEVMSDCQRGECGVCAIDIVAVDGQIDHRDVFFSDHQKQANAKICPCVSRAVGAITVNTLYRSNSG